MVYWTAYYISLFCSKIFFPIFSHGLENLPQQGAYILASNHVSNLDPVILRLSTKHKLNFLAKEALFTNKIFGALLMCLGAFPIRRDSADVGALKEAIRRLKKGHPLLIFPEGTRKVESKENHPGIGFIVAKSGVPVIPAYIIGSDQVLAPGQKIPLRRKVSVFYGKPISFHNPGSYQEMTNQIVNDIYALTPPVINS